VTAFVRRLNRFPAAKYKNVKIIEGDVTDEEKVKFALKDQDFVVSCLGKGLNLSPTTVISEGVSNIVKGMKANGVKKIFVVSISSRLPDSKSNGPWILKNIAADHTRMLDVLKRSGDEIEWCGIMVGEILDLPPAGDYQVAIGTRPAGRKVVLSGDIGQFIASNVVDDSRWPALKNQLIGMSSAVSFSQFTKTTHFPIILGVLSGFAAVVAFTAYKFVQFVSR